MKIKCFLIATSLLLAHNTLKAQAFLAEISFGYDQAVFDGAPSPFTQAGDDVWGKLKDSSNALLTSTNSVAGIGYFTTTPNSFSANPDIFDNFVFLTSSLVSADYNGELDAVGSNVDVDAAIGKKAYLAFFKGITDVANYADATELGLVSSMLWDTINGVQAPGTPTSLTYAIGKTAIDSSNGGQGGVHIGSEEDDTRFSSGEGFNYQTVAVPESSTYALLLGSLALACTFRRRKA
jgi:hypothetical protein